MTKPFAKVRSSAIDGRAQNPYYRKAQLKQLHATLADNAAQIQEAIKKDTNNRPVEVKIEYWLALQCIADAFTSINPEKALEEEYAIANGHDDANNREPVGIVVIEPSSHAFFYSLIAALVPAIAAGNCVIVQTRNSLLETPNLVLGLVEKSLDQDIFEITSQEATAAAINHPHIRVLQNGSTEPVLKDNLVSDSKKPVVAFVERDADVQAAAKALVGARFGLQGRSPYAPDVVLVNEWVKKDLLRALVQQSTDFIANPNDSRGKGKALKSELLRQAEKDGSTHVISSGSDGAILEVENRQSALLKQKVTESYLIVHSVTSMDDAIDASRSIGSLAAAYVFTTPDMAKYLCQFVDADISFINKIPIKLMYSPIAPEGHPPQPNHYGLYHETLFSRSKPKYLTNSNLDNKLATFSNATLSHQLSAIDQEATKKLPEIARLKKAGGIGFFNQGIVTGLVLILTTFVSGTGLMGYYAVKYWRA
ncbi:aldehyde dehydrogenase family 3 member b1 [Fusarium albosuccineum]|uniref:Aldehyde dehydrogenase family 3 member b1 n=1 Tax=Fusarium albosuccineum TaxID=1237068 RepID=A0A8H4LBE3_9HYPO|nr:aldehyde dehydrogenase family 3 member b1 [Fusarium albosuccineum]